MLQGGAGFETFFQGKDSIVCDLFAAIQEIMKTTYLLILPTHEIEGKDVAGIWIPRDSLSNGPLQHLQLSYSFKVFNLIFF